MYIRASQVAQWWSICLQGKKRCSFIPGWRRSPSIGNGNALQCSCLEHSMDRGSWWATVHGVAKSQTRLSDWTTYTCRSQSPNSSHPSVLTPAAMQPSKTEPGGNRKYKQIITSNKIETVIKNLKMYKSPRPDDFTGEFYHSFREEITPILLKLFPNNRRERSTPKFFLRGQDHPNTKIRQWYHKKSKLQTNRIDEHRC